jgi:hypothetical protein
MANSLKAFFFLGAALGPFSSASVTRVVFGNLKWLIHLQAACLLAASKTLVGITYSSIYLITFFWGPIESPIILPLKRTVIFLLLCKTLQALGEGG